MPDCKGPFSLQLSHLFMWVKPLRSIRTSGQVCLSLSPKSRNFNRKSSNYSLGEETYSNCSSCTKEHSFTIFKVVTKTETLFSFLMLKGETNCFNIYVTLGHLLTLFLHLSNLCRHVHSKRSIVSKSILLMFRLTSII